MPNRGKEAEKHQADALTSQKPAKRDAAGQYAASPRTSPNPDGLVSANPVVLSGDGDATTGNGHGRDREQKGAKAG